jgi:DNA repair exonuclease SbcCD ATPase subunit
LTDIGTGEVIYKLRKRIQRITAELNELEKKSNEIPELIKSTNLLRTNDHLVELNNKKSELTFAYAKYSKELEQLLETVFDIQKDLKDILKTQSSLISENGTKKMIKTRRKPTKK